MTKSDLVSESDPFQINTLICKQIMKFLVKDSNVISIVNQEKENLRFPTFKFCYCVFVCIFTGLNPLNLSVLVMPIKITSAMENFMWKRIRNSHLFPILK